MALLYFWATGVASGARARSDSMKELQLAPVFSNASAMSVWETMA